MRDRKKKGGGEEAGARISLAPMRPQLSTSNLRRLSALNSYAVRGSVEAGEPTRHQIALPGGANQGALMLA
jgi:hypothetical protein